MWHRLRQFLAEYPEVGYAFLAGLIGVAVAAWVGSIHPNIQTFCFGIGSSLCAAALVSLFSYVRQQYHQQFAELGIRNIYAYRNAVDYTQWCAWLGNARTRCIIIGIANARWCGDREFPPAVRGVVQRNVELKFFFLDPTKDIARLRSEEEQRETARNTREAICGSIKFMWDLKTSLPAAQRQLFRLYVYNGTPCGTIWIDDFMIVTHYLPGSANVTSPALRIEFTGRRDDLYQIYKENAEKVEQHCSIEITEGNIANYIPAIGS